MESSSFLDVFDVQNLCVTVSQTEELELILHLGQDN